MKENASVPAVAEKAELTFVEVPCHTSTETNTYMVSDKPVATIIGDKYGQNPFEKGTLFLFYGKRSDRCKGLLCGRKKRWAREREMKS